jgi:hypothetical protein
MFNTRAAITLRVAMDIGQAIVLNLVDDRASKI